MPTGGHAQIKKMRLSLPSALDFTLHRDQCFVIDSAFLSLHIILIVYSFAGDAGSKGMSKPISRAVMFHLTY
jgi:hypothetical protein